MSNKIKVSKVYHVKRRYSQLRVRINRRAYKCGQNIRDTNFLLSSISSCGKVELTDETTGHKLNFVVDDCPDKGLYDGQ